MVLVEKTRDDLKRINLIITVLNFIFSGFKFFTIIYLIYLMIALSSMSGGVSSSADIALVYGLIGLVGGIVLIFELIVPIVIAVLSLKNRKNIMMNQPKLAPYYIGCAFAVIDMINTLFGSNFNIFGVAIQAGLLSIYVLAIKKSKELQNSSK